MTNLPQRRTSTNKRGIAQRRISRKRTNAEQNANAVGTITAEPIDRTSPENIMLLRRYNIRHCSVRLLQQTVDEMRSDQSPTAAAAAHRTPIGNKILQNTDKQMYVGSPEVRLKCLLCHVHPSSLIDHYTNEHGQAENYVARLPPDIAAELHTEGQSRLERAQRIPKSPYKIGQKCIFCNLTCALTKGQWYIHIQSHTGELNFHCHICLRMLARPSHTCYGRKQRLESIEKTPKGHRIEVHICQLCNFIQLKRNTVVRHLINQHGVGQVRADGSERITVIDCLWLDTHDVGDA